MWFFFILFECLDPKESVQKNPGQIVGDPCCRVPVVSVHSAVTFVVASVYSRENKHDWLITSETNLNEEIFGVKSEA